MTQVKVTTHQVNASSKPLKSTWDIEFEAELARDLVRALEREANPIPPVLVDQMVNAAISEDSVIDKAIDEHKIQVVELIKQAKGPELQVVTKETPGRGHLIQLTKEMRIRQDVERATAMKYLLGKGDVYVDPFTLQVDVGGHVKMDLESEIYKEIPIKFYKVDGNFECQQAAIESFKNAPREVTGNCIVNNCWKVSSLEGLPELIGGRLNIHRCNIKSFHNIHKVVKHAQSIYFSQETTHDLLGLLFINGLKEVRCMIAYNYNDTTKPGGPPLEKLNDILNKHLNGQRDIIKCQDEMIDAGFVTQANI